MLEEEACMLECTSVPMVVLDLVVDSVGSTIVHKNITYIKNYVANYFSPGYKYNYINNCRES